MRKSKLLVKRIQMCDFKSLSLLIVIPFMSLHPVFADEYITIDATTMDDLGFDSVIDDQLFSSRVTFKNSSALKLGNKGSVLETNLELATDSLLSQSFSSITPLGENLDSLTSEYHSQGLKVKRLSSSWKSGAGALTVGSDWANFQDILELENSPTNTSLLNSSVSSQIKWLSPNGFSIALEDSVSSELFIDSDQVEGDLKRTPSVILSWQGGAGGTAGEYRVSAMGTRIDSKVSGQSFDARDTVGWGLNLEGGWQIGDLFAALSVTYGKGINSYILRRFGNELLVTPNEEDLREGAYSIRPSLYYSLNDSSNFHVALGRYSSSEPDSYQLFDTLDTIHLGYTWSPWPSTKFGLELVDQNGDIDGVNIDDTRLKFGAQKLF